MIYKYDNELDKNTLLSELKELDFISNFIMYDKFNLSKKKLRKKLKKLIYQVENDKKEKFLITTEELYEI